MEWNNNQILKEKKIFLNNNLKKIFLTKSIDVIFFKIQGG